MKYFRKYTTVKEALDFEVEHNDFVITGWPFIPAVQIQTASGTDTNFERHHVHTKVGPSFNAGYFSDDFSNSDNYGRKVYLPTDWILLSYIENTVAAGGYIDMGYAPSMTSTDSLTTLDFDITFSITTLPSSGNTSTVFSICGQACTINSSGNISFAGASVSTVLSVNAKYTVHIHWGATSGTTGNVSMSVFNVTDLTSTDKLVGSATSTSQTLTTANLVLFDATAGLVGRMYYFGVYEDNDIKLDMVPVVGQDNMAGMYNIRSAEFMGNSRTVTGPMYMTRTVGDIVDSTTGYQVTSTGEYAKIDTLYGNSIVWNQLVQNGDFSNGINNWMAYNSSNITISYGDKCLIANVIGSTGGGYNYGVRQNISIDYYTDYFFVRFDINPSVNCGFGFEFYNKTSSYVNCIANQWNHLSFIMNGTSENNAFIIKPQGNSVTTNDTYKIKNVTLINLKKLFGSDAQIAAALGVSTSQLTSQAAIDAFEAMFPASYYPYNTGELLCFEGERLDTSDTVSGEHSTDISAWKGLKDPSDPSKLFFPNGLCSAGDVYDEVTPTQAIKRIGSAKIANLTFYNGISTHRYFGVLRNSINAKGNTNNLTCAFYSRGTNRQSIGVTDKTMYIGSQYLYFTDSKYDNSSNPTEDFKADMATLNAEVFFELAEPIVVNIPQRQDYSYPVSTATVESIQPDNAMLSLGWNQLTNWTNISTLGRWSGTAEYSFSKDGSMLIATCTTVSGVFSFYTSLPLIPNDHRVYTAIDVSNTINVDNFRIRLGRSGNGSSIMGTVTPTMSRLSQIGTIANSTDTRYTNFIFETVPSVSITEGNITRFDNWIVQDLTQMFGSDDEIAAALGISVADITTNVGVAAFERLFPADYYPYNAGQQIYVYPSQQYYSIPASPSSGETKPFSAPAITTNTYSGFGEPQS